MGQPRTVGILGGMGPEATILLQRKLMDAVLSQDDSDHIPLLIDMNTQVPSRIAHLIDGTGVDPSKVLGVMARRLQNAGAAALAMPCNTAHHYANVITGQVDIPFLNMVELSADRAAKQLGIGGRVGILASPAVRYTKLLENALADRGLSAMWPNNDDIALDAIRLIKSKGPCDTACDAMYSTSLELASAGADLQLIACSEFSLVSDCVASEVQAIDTIDVLTQAIVKFSLNPNS
jgi:aspartate racemase